MAAKDILVVHRRPASEALKDQIGWFAGAYNLELFSRAFPAPVSRPRRECAAEGCQAGKPEADSRVLAHVPRDLARAGRSRSEIGAGTDAALPHLDNDGYLRADRIDRAAPGDRKAFGFCATSTLFHYCSNKRGVSVLKKEQSRIESTITYKRTSLLTIGVECWCSAAIVS